jgi:hypothetical protein
MKLKELGKKVFNPKVVGIIGVVAAGAGAMIEAIDGQKKEKAFRELQQKVAELEKK